MTVLTSLSAEDVAAVGFTGTPEAAALRLARLAVGAGVDGLVCSPREAEALGARSAPRPSCARPGIRPAGAAKGDQARAETPAFAVRAGADLLVVGRPIHTAADPVAAARAIAEEVSAA